MFVLCTRFETLEALEFRGDLLDLIRLVVHEGTVVLLQNVEQEHLRVLVRGLERVVLNFGVKLCARDDLLLYVI